MLGTRQSGSPKLDKALPYEDQLLWIIQYYIQERSKLKKDSRGIDRAHRLIDHINTQLLVVERLNTRQLQSRILNYALADSGLGIFESSYTLRKMIVAHLCESLDVSEEMIAKRYELLMLLDIKTALATPLFIGLFYFPDEKENYMHAMLLEAQIALLKLPRFASGKSNQTLDAINRVLDASIPYQGLEFVTRLKKYILGQWLRMDGLDENQMIWRMVEELEQPLRPEFRDVKQKLCVAMLRALSQCAKCDEDEICEKLKDITPAYPGKLSMLGPIPRLFHSDMSEINIRLASIKNRISIGYVPVCPKTRVELTSSCESMELQTMRR